MSRRSNAYSERKDESLHGQIHYNSKDEKKQFVRVGKHSRRRKESLNPQRGACNEQTCRTYLISRKAQKKVSRSP